MAPDMGSSTGHIRQCIFVICAGGCNAVDGREDKRDGGIIFSGYAVDSSDHKI
jgi:hypothetical protein